MFRRVVVQRDRQMRPFQSHRHLQTRQLHLHRQLHLYRQLVEVNPRRKLQRGLLALSVAMALWSEIRVLFSRFQGGLKVHVGNCKSSGTLANLHLKIAVFFRTCLLSGVPVLDQRAVLIRRLQSRHHHRHFRLRSRPLMLLRLPRRRKEVAPFVVKVWL